MKKVFVVLLVTSLLFGVLAGCGAKETKETKETQAVKEAADVVTSASIVDNAEAFLKAVSKDGTWIVATLNDLTIDKEIVLEGAFTNKDKPARKIALYAQDENRKQTASYTLKAPKLTVKSENGSIVKGTFVGDVYVEANGFSLQSAKIEGNLYFASEEFKASSKIDDKSSVTGATEVMGEKETADVVTSASIVDNAEAFLKAVSKDGTWIVATLNDLTIDKEIVLEGAFTNKDKPARKIALYAQDENRKQTASYTLKAPKLTVKSENGSIVKGTFVGDVYVEANGFSLQSAKIEGNLYFASEEFKASSKIDDKSSVTGATEVKK